MIDRDLTLVHVTTVPWSLLALINDQVTFMQSRGLTVHAISSGGAMADEFAQRYGVRLHVVPMTRAMSPFRDLLSLWSLWRALGDVRPDIVHSHTPKGGLLGTLAAWMRGVPVRVYHLRGLRYATATGVQRAVLRAADRTACRLAHRVIAVSESIRTQAIADGLCAADRIIVLGGGSGNGVDALTRFDPDRPPPGGASIRERFDIPPSALVIGMVGRLAREKGIVELELAWQRIRQERTDVHLLLVGPDEAVDAPSLAALARLRADDRVHCTGHVASAEMAAAYRGMDLVVLPSHREGLPNALLEAAAMRLPVVATRIPGCTDVVIDGVTGTLVPPERPDQLAAALSSYLRDPERRSLHAAAARGHVLERFQPQVIWSALAAEYERLCRDRAS
jgi:glycosyltransferase involved in cell wall biosynthesis